MDYFHPSNWQVADSGVIDASMIAKIRRYLDQTGYLFGLHSLFCGGRGPLPVAFDDSDKFEKYVAQEMRPGDKLTLWALPDTEPEFFAVSPNEKGQVPIKGAY